MQNLAALEQFYHTLGFVSKKTKFKNFVCPRTCLYVWTITDDVFYGIEDYVCAF